ncbi:MAG: B12-binding domain-containing radical SAM protein [Dorea sp.]|nr:B12-binding domain-containing radical SAM protein [Dorea sp.]
MKILLVAINAKYIHSNLAIYSLKAYAEKWLETYSGLTSGQDAEIKLTEYTINQPISDILMDIYRKKPDILCFSCYIWNMEHTEALVKEIAKLCPHMPIWLGGPEVSYDAVEVLGRLPQVKGIMKGEGEETFAKLCQIYALQGHPVIDDSCLREVQGISYRDMKCGIQDNPWRQAIELGTVPFVYQNMETFQNKIIYYESSRGCPFSCSYCLSSVDKHLRFRDINLVKQELQFFLDQGVSQVKFVDRTFNCKHDHAIEIWRYIAEHDNGITNFHFEVAADIFNDEEMALLAAMRPGLVQLEIGIQSTNPDTIRAIQRTMDFAKVRNAVEKIRIGGNIHQHLDLIAGLPFEGIDSFAKSFDDVYSLKPEQLQLGFLKVLKGSGMERQKDAYGLVYQSRPPYEVLYTRWLSYEDVIRLKGIEEMVEVYYNSRQFVHTLEELGWKYPSAFTMYDKLNRFYEAYGYGGIKHKRCTRYEILLQYIGEEHPQEQEYFRELLTYDYYLRENAKTRPEFAGEYKISKEDVRAFYEKEETERKYLPAYGAYDRNQMRKMSHLEYFELMGKCVLFDYKERNVLSQDARTCEILYAFSL